MIKDLAEATAAHGLELHPEKTKILSNVVRRKNEEAAEYAQIGDNTIEILKRTESTKYLGKLLVFANPHEKELDNRINAGWRKFGLYRQELTSKTYALKQRLKLFDAVISPTILYGCASWTLTQDLANRLRKTQRKMLRLILGAKRRASSSNNIGDNRTDTTDAHNNNSNDNDEDNATDDTSDSDGSDVTSLVHDDPDEHPAHHDDDEEDDEEEREADLEPWVVWLQRTTRYMEDQLGKIQCDDWVSAYRRRKWRWAGQVARAQDERWSFQVAQWMQDRRKNRAQSGLRRRQGRPNSRWSDEIAAYLQETYGEQLMEWTDVALDAATWEHLEEDFVRKTWQA